jgi:hypothetical protein
MGLVWPLCACETHSAGLRIGQILWDQVAGVTGSDGVPRSQVAAISYATLGVRLGSSGEAMFVLQAKSGGDLHWVGGTQFAIATRDGRILRTTGFVHNLTGFQDVSSPAVQAAGEISQEYQYDLADINAYGVIVRCSEHDAGQEQIDVVGGTHTTRHVIQDCSAPELDWSFSNEFWRDVDSNYVWRSLQYVHPGLDPIELESLRPAN